MVLNLETIKNITCGAVAIPPEADGSPIISRLRSCNLPRQSVRRHSPFTSSQTTGLTNFFYALKGASVFLHRHSTSDSRNSVSSQVQGTRNSTKGSRATTKRRAMPNLSRQSRNAPANASATCLPCVHRRPTVPLAANNTIRRKMRPGTQRAN